MAEIYVIAPYRKLAQLAREVAQELGLEVEVRIGRLLEGARLARQACREGAAVLVSQGATAWQIAQENLPLPLVEIIPTCYDLLRAVAAARKKGNKLGILERPELIAGCAALEEALGITIVKVPLQSFRQVDEGISTLAAAGVDVILGNICVQSRALARGMEAVLIPCGREAVSQALKEAGRVLEVQRREKERAEEIRALVNFVDDGIVAVDAQGRITAVNPAAERILGTDKATLLGRDASALSSLGTRILGALASGKAELGEVETLRDGVRVAVNIMPITIGSQVTGAVATFQEISRLQLLDQKVRRSLQGRGHVAKYFFSDIIGPSPKTRAVVEKAMKFGKVDATVLILGETGVGKEYFAHAMHSVSPRREGPFIAVNCAAVPENLLESELFGYAEGAFTGARKGGKPGLFELAHGGTIFLDEISEMSERLQTRLLRVLQEREVMRLGDNRVIPVDIRVIAATNRDLGRLVEENRFRADLYYRINVLTLVIPPLRERKEDIPALVAHFLEAFSRKFGKDVRAVAPHGMDLLVSYDWPGNIRELRNVMERLVILAEGEVVPADLVAECLFAAPVPRKQVHEHLPSLARAEEELIREALAAARGNKKKAAALLGISRTTLWRRLRQFHGGTPEVSS